MRDLIQDIGQAVRQLRRRPTFGIAVVVTLALGIGGTTAIFTFVDGILFRPLPYPEEARLLAVCETHADMPATWCGASPGNLESWRAASQTIEAFGLGRRWSWAVELEAGALSGVEGGVASAGLFAVFGTGAQRGRLFEPGDSTAGAASVAVISHSYWQRRLAGETEAVGRSVLLDGVPHEVVGVLPEGFEVPGLDGVELWVPVWPEHAANREWRGFRSFGRLAQGVTLADARAEIALLREALAAEYPDSNAAWGVIVDSLRARMVRSVRPALLVFMGAVGLLLLVACANVANLVLARTTERRSELAVRSALGAGRWRLLRQLLAESGLLAVLGGVSGALLATWLVDILLAFAPPQLPRLDQVELDLTALIFAAALSVATVLLFGLAPALRVEREASALGLRERGRGGGSSWGGRSRSTLVASQLALALLLVTGAGLLLRSFATLLDWRPGFDRTQLVSVQVFPPAVKYTDGTSLARVATELVEAVAALPGMTSAAAGSALPLRGGDGAQEYLLPGRPAPPTAELPTAEWFDAGPGYFRTLGIPVKRGRSFTEADRRGAPPVAVVNETFARRHWPDSDPLGARIELLAHQMTVEIVGVVGDVDPFQPGDVVPAQIFWPFAQQPRGAFILMARAAGDAAATIPALRERLAAIEPDLQLGAFLTMDELVDRQLQSPRFTMLLVGLFATLAFVLATLGVYGLVSYGVAHRTWEFGLRMAIGARRADVLRLVLGQGFRLAAAGTLGGLVAALVLTRFLGRLLVGVSATDPWVLAGGSALLVATVLLATYLPARRASRVAPLTAMRPE